jgi:hypothetical protein
LGGASWSGGDAVQVELAQLVVVLGHGTLTLKGLQSAVRSTRHTVSEVLWRLEHKNVKVRSKF